MSANTCYLVVATDGLAYETPAQRIIKAYTSRPSAEACAATPERKPHGNG